MLSEAIAYAGRQPVWRYFYEGDFKNARLTPHAGAYHTAEIPMVFGTYPRDKATQVQINLSADMQGIWSGFVKNPWAGAGWPRIGSTKDGVELGVLGGTPNPSGVSVQPLWEADAVCPILDPVIIVAQGAY
jgi:carboxylesterase type B